MSREVTSDQIIDSRAVDGDVAQSVSEIIDIASDPPGARDRGGPMRDRSMPRDFDVHHINDPVYQSLLATGLFRPR